MAKNHSTSENEPVSEEFPLSFFACSNPDCADFNRFDAGNLSIAERMSKDKAIRRLYCKTCNQRFSEREGSLMAGTKYNKKLSSALSSVLDTVVPLKQPQTYVRSTREPFHDCWKRPANAQKIYIDCNWKNSNDRLKPYNLMNYTAELPKSQKRAKHKKPKHRPKGRAWVHTALEVTSHFVIDLRLGPRTLETACQLIASVAVCCAKTLPLLLIDDHLPYPTAILRIFGQIKHRRKRKKGRVRRLKPNLKLPPNLLVGVVKKIRNSRGRLLKVTTYALCGRIKDIERSIRQLKIGKQINTSHLERLNGTLRGQQTHLARRTRNGSGLSCALQWSLLL